MALYNNRNSKIKIFELLRKYITVVEISNKCNTVKNPNWYEADQLAIYKA